MKTSLKVLTLTGLLTVGGLTSCSQTFEETPQPTTPTTPTSPTSGTVTLMPGQTVTGIDGVQITAPKEIEGWDGKPIKVEIERTSVKPIDLTTNMPILAYSFKSVDNSEEIGMLRISIPNVYNFDMPSGRLISRDFSGEEGVNGLHNISIRNNDLQINLYHIEDEVILYIFNGIYEVSSNSINNIVEMSNGDYGYIEKCEYASLAERLNGIIFQPCKTPFKEVKKYLDSMVQDYGDFSSEIEFVVSKPAIDEKDLKRMEDRENAGGEKASDGDCHQFKRKMDGSLEKDKNGYSYEYLSGLYLGSQKTIYLCRYNEQTNLLTAKHELFHAYQQSLIKFGDRYSTPHGWAIEGSAKLSENSSKSNGIMIDRGEEFELDFTLPWNYLHQGNYTSSAYPYSYQDFLYYLGKVSGRDFAILKDIVSAVPKPISGRPDTRRLSTPDSYSTLVEFEAYKAAGIDSLRDAWWKFNLDRAIENKYPLRPGDGTRETDDKRCRVNSRFIRNSLNEAIRTKDLNLSTLSTTTTMSVGSYDTDYRHYQITGSETKEVIITPASSFKVGQDSIRAAVYLRTGEGSDVTCNSIAPQADGTYKIPNVKAGDQILLAAGNLKEVANPVNLDFTLTTAAPASYKRVKVNFGKALYYDNAPSPLSESARRGGKVYAQDFGRSMAISENEFWIDTNGLASGEKPSIGVEPLKGFTLDNSRITGTCEVTYAPSSHSLLFNNLKDDCEINLQFRFQVSDFKLDCPREVYGIGHAKYPGEQSCNAIAYGKSDYYDGPLAPQPPIEVYAAPANIVELTPSSSPTRWLITPQNNGTVTIGATIYDSSYGNNDHQSGITNSNEVVVQSHVRDEIPPLPYTLSNVTLTCLPGQIEVNTSRDVCTATATASDGTTAKDVTNEATFEFSPVNSAIATITNSDQQWIGKVTGVSAGEARFTVTATWNGERKTSVESGAVQIVAPTPVIDPALQGTAEITVIDAATAAPVSSVVFKACTTTSVCRTITVQEQSPGVYVLPLNEGTYTLQVSREGYLPASMQNVAIVRGQKTILERHLILDKTIVGEGTIRGRLLNAVSGAGVANVKLDIRQELYNATGAVVTTVTTDSEGRYSLNLPTGYYTATATVDGYLPVVFNVYAIGGKVVDLGDRAMSPVLAATGDWRVVLTWGASPSDLDSHLTGPTANGNRFHVYFDNSSYQDTSTNVLLDRDDTTSYGPETTTIKSTTPGLLKYSVHDYSNRGYSGSALSNSGAKVELYRGSSAQALATFYVPAGNGDLWTVFTIDTTNPQAPKITPINTITTVGGSSSVQSVPNPNVEQQKSGFNLRSPLW